MRCPPYFWLASELRLSAPTPSREGSRLCLSISRNFNTTHRRRSQTPCMRASSKR
ncbi:hypothetical protein ACFFX0_09920 [Citricoccus parietis]|uniref:Uncharacterized protein n=1 Tax=Citricoccus parietis TaxID=592307 RepID=A0ABV5FXU0_9MICC